MAIEEGGSSYLSIEGPLNYYFFLRLWNKESMI
jgi:hypothetical protein